MFNWFVDTRWRFFVSLVITIGVGANAGHIANALLESLWALLVWLVVGVGTGAVAAKLIHVRERHIERSLLSFQRAKMYMNGLIQRDVQ